MKVARGLAVAWLCAPSLGLADPIYNPRSIVLGGGLATVYAPHQNRDDEFSAGLEFSLNYFPDRHRMRAVGVFADLAYTGGGPVGMYSALGVQASYWVIGAELGLDLRSAANGYGFTAGGLAGAFFTLGLAWVGVRVSVPFAAEASPLERGVEGHLVVGFKIPFWGVGDFPAYALPIPSIMPNRRTERGQSGRSTISHQ